ncbi:hypothetical protein [Gynurincola endophyticus]|uniref:hypothetical protein n=1 Tax=Gynurincola endophyticus TaxID=2479004 RepID=UPI000F8C7E4F|nr:hypothetical protein [Gynurincola endophyticus]
MLKFTPPYIEFERYIIFRDNNYPELFYYLSLCPQISLFEDRPAVLIEYEKNAEQVNHLLLRFKINYIATAYDITEIQNFLRNKFRIRYPYLVPAPMGIAKVYLQLQEEGRTVWTSAEDSQSMVNRFSQIAQFVAKNEIAASFYNAIMRGGCSVNLNFTVSVVGFPPENPASLFIEWAGIYSYFDQSANRPYNSDEIFDMINKWMSKNLDTIHFSKMDKTIRGLATLDMMNEVRKIAFKKLFVKGSHNKQLPLDITFQNNIHRYDLQKKFFLREASTISPASEEINLVWKSQKSIDFKYVLSLKDLARNIARIAEYVVDTTNFSFLNKITLYVAIANNTFDFVNIRKIEVLIEIWHRKTNTIEKNIYITFEKGGKSLHELAYDLLDQYHTYQVQFKVLYSIIQSNNYTIENIEMSPKVEHKTHLFIDPTRDFNVYFVRFLLDKAKRLAIFDSILAKITFRSHFKKNAIWEVSESLNKDSREFTLAFVSTLDGIRAKVEVEYIVNNAKVANTVYTNVAKSNYIVDNPFEHCWEVEVSAEANWADTRKIILEASAYEQNSNSVYVKRIELNKDEPQQMIGFSRRHLFNEYSFYYRMFCVEHDGVFRCQSGLKHTGEKLTVSDCISNIRTIHGYLPSDFSFRHKNYSKIGWTLRYLDKSNKINFVSATKYFTDTERYQQISHEMANPYLIDYEYSFSLEYDDGTEREKSVWLKADQDQIFLEIE